MGRDVMVFSLQMMTLVSLLLGIGAVVKALRTIRRESVDEPVAATRSGTEARPATGSETGLGVSSFRRYQPPRLAALRLASALQRLLRHVR